MPPKSTDVGSPPPETASSDRVAFSTRTPAPSPVRVAVVAVATVILAIGVVATSLAGSPAPSAAGPAGETVPVPFLATEPDLDEPVELDHGRFRGPGFGEITITAIDGSNVTLTTDDGWTRTIALADGVELTKGGQEIAVADLTVGDQVRLRQVRNDDGTYTVQALAVVVPSVRGEVSDVSSTGFKVTTRDGSVWTVAVNGATAFRYGKGEGTLADVTNGVTVVVLGTSSGDNALIALTVRVKPDRAVGTVTAKTPDTITIQTRRGASLTVHVDAETTYRVRGVETADLGDVAVDMVIGVSGRARADGSIDADAVVAGPGRGFPRGGFAPFGGADGNDLVTDGAGILDEWAEEASET